MLGSGGGQANNGMGNLADELADAFSDSGEEDETQDGTREESPKDRLNSEVAKLDGSHDSGVDVNGTTPVDGDKSKDAKLVVPSPPRRGHQRKGSEYDGSEYGSESDLDAAGLTANLLSRIDAVESLVRRGTENYGGPEDDVFKRVTESLRDLGSQSSVEGNASRYVADNYRAMTHMLTTTVLLRRIRHSPRTFLTRLDSFITLLSPCCHRLHRHPILTPLTTWYLS